MVFTTRPSPIVFLGWFSTLSDFQANFFADTTPLSFEIQLKSNFNSKLKRKENELKILRMKISKFNCQEKELQMLKIQNFNFQKINRELRFDISADKILIKQLHDDLDKLKSTKK